MQNLVDAGILTGQQVGCAHGFTLLCLAVIERRTDKIPRDALYTMTLESVLSARLIGAAKLLARDRPTQRGADKTNIKAARAQREDAPHQGHDTEEMIPEDKAEAEECQGRDDAKGAPSRAVDEGRET